MPAEVIQTLALYWVAVAGLSLYFLRREADLDKKLGQRGKKT